MQKTLLAAVAVGAILSGATLGTSATAMTLAAPSVLGIASADTMPIERVANVCGISGCSPVWTKRVQKPSPNFVKRAVPLVITVNQQHQNDAPLR
jgi:hypothetical protein